MKKLYAYDKCTTYAFSVIISLLYPPIYSHYFWLSILDQCSNIISAWCLCQCNGPLAVHTTAWSSIKKSSWRMFIACGSWCWPNTTQLPFKECVGCGAYTRAGWKNSVWVFQFCIIKSFCFLHYSLLWILSVPFPHNDVLLLASAAAVVEKRLHILYLFKC